MFRYEWKKLLHYRRGSLLIALFLVAELQALLLFTQPYDKVLEENRAVYDSYLALVEGSLTEDSREYIEGEMDRLNTVHRQMERLKTDYYSGAVTEAEFRTQFEALVDDDSAYTGFARLYRQYIFVRETEIRSFLYTGGWEVLLGNREPDYLFLLLMVFLLTPVFCQEYGSQMDQILLTQKGQGFDGFKSYGASDCGIAVVQAWILRSGLRFAPLGLYPSIAEQLWHHGKDHAPVAGLWATVCAEGDWLSVLCGSNPFPFCVFQEV